MQDHETGKRELIAAAFSAAGLIPVESTPAPGGGTSESDAPNGPHGPGCQCGEGERETEEEPELEELRAILTELSRQTRLERRLTRQAIAEALSEGEKIPVTLLLGAQDEFSAQVYLARHPELN